MQVCSRCGHWWESEDQIHTPYVYEVQTIPADKVDKLGNVGTSLSAEGWEIVAAIAGTAQKKNETPNMQVGFAPTIPYDALFLLIKKEKSRHERDEAAKNCPDCVPGKLCPKHGAALQRILERQKNASSQP